MTTANEPIPTATALDDMGDPRKWLELRSQQAAALEIAQREQTAIIEEQRQLALRNTELGKRMQRIREAIAAIDRVMALERS